MTYSAVKAAFVARKIITLTREECQYLESVFFHIKLIGNLMGKSTALNGPVNRSS